MADTKTTALTENSAPVSTDIIPMVDDPGGTPATQKSTLSNLTKALNPSALTNKATPVGADELILGDSEASNVAKALTLTALAPVIKSLESLLADLSEDTTPQLGGNLDLNSNDITGTGDINHTGALTTSGAADVGSLQARASVINAETASFTFALADAGKLTTISNAGSTTATIPPNSSVTFPVGTMLYLAQIGAGACTWTEGAGVTINVNSNFADPAVTNGQYSYSFARKTATDTWEVGGQIVPLNPLESWSFPISAVGEDLTTGTGKLSWRTPYAITLTDIKASVATAPTGASVIIDVNEGGATIMDTNKLEIEASETTTEDATTQPTLSDTALAADALITFDIDQIGSSTAGQEAVVTLIGRRT